MKIKTEEFQEICKTILSAVDSEKSRLAEALELKTEGKTLYLNVASNEYFASVKFELDEEEEFRAVVNASLFLKLIASITTDYIELTLKETYVSVKANGNYKIPLTFDGASLYKLPEIKIDNPTVNMKINGDILMSILNYNSKELLRGNPKRPVQKMYYIDNNGCITFVTGACVNNFTLEKPVRVLLSNKIVKLFKLFKKDVVDFTLGYDAITDDVVQTKVKFETDTISIVVATECNDTLLNSVPISAIKGRIEYPYPINAVISKNELLEAINRLLLFSAGYDGIKNTKPFSKFVCEGNTITIYDSKEENKEIITLRDEDKIDEEYSMEIDLLDLKTILDTVTEDYITLSFGNYEALVLRRLNISNIIPEKKREE